jgi:hypothetical protein
VAKTRYPNTSIIRAAAAREISPMSNDWLIKTAELINEGRRFHADLRVTARNLDVHPPS